MKYRITLKTDETNFKNTPKKDGVIFADTIDGRVLIPCLQSLTVAWDFIEYQLPDAIVFASIERIKE